MQLSRGRQLIGITILLVGCGGSDEKMPPPAPAIPNQGEFAPPVSEQPARPKRSQSGSKSRLDYTVDDNDPNLMEWNERLTALRKIRAGMTSEQVEGILGIADETDDDNDPSGVLAERGETLTILTWRGDDPSDDGDFIKIGFINERLKDRSYITVNAARQ